jgi:hypothetical protein
LASASGQATLAWLGLAPSSSELTPSPGFPPPSVEILLAGLSSVAGHDAT